MARARTVNTPEELPVAPPEAAPPEAAPTTEFETLTTRVDMLEKEREDMHRSHLRSEKAWRKAGEEREEKIRAAEIEADKYRTFFHSMRSRVGPMMKQLLQLGAMFSDSQLTDEGKEHLAEVKRLYQLMQREEL
jgi:hypothetical protein